MTVAATTPLDLQRAAKEHLWMHFTRMGGFETADVPIIVRGDGCHLEDSNGRRYIDALAGLFSVNIGYSFGDEIGTMIFVVALGLMLANILLQRRKGST